MSLRCPNTTLFPRGEVIYILSLTCLRTPRLDSYFHQRLDERYFSIKRCVEPNNIVYIRNFFSILVKKKMQWLAILTSTLRVNHYVFLFFHSLYISSLGLDRIDNYLNTRSLSHYII